jgi:mannosyltransferase
MERPSTVIMHGIDTARFHPAADRREVKAALGLAPGKRHVGCFGRIRRQKGTDLFVDSMIALLPDRPGWVAVIAGRTTAEHVTFERELRERVEAAGLSDRILFVGEHTDIERWYRALDLFVAPQRWEGFGLTPLEAMASGVPVVAADVGAFSELVVEGETGTVIPRGDLAELTAACSRLIDDDLLRARWSETATVHAREEFSLDRETDALLACYRKLAGEAEKRSR